MNNICDGVKMTKNEINNNNATKIDVEQIYMEYQQLMQQMQLFDKQFQQLDAQGSEFLSVLETLSELPNAEDNNEILVPISSGIFVKAKLEEKNKVLVNVGGSVVSEKTVEDTRKLIESQLGEIENLRNQMMSNRQLIIARIEQIRSLLADK